MSEQANNSGASDRGQIIKAASHQSAADSIEALIRHLEERHSHQQQAQQTSSAEVIAQLDQHDEALKKVVRWSALGPIVPQMRHNLGLLALDFPWKFYAAVALGAGILVAALAESVFGGLIVGLLLSVSLAEIIRQYRLAGVQERVRAKLIVYLGRNENDHEQHCYEYFHVDRSGTPCLTEIALTNIEEPAESSIGVIFVNEASSPVGWVTETTKGWRAQVVGGHPQVPAGVPILVDRTKLIQQGAKVYESLNALANGGHGVSGSILRKDEVQSRWADIALAAPIRSALLTALVHFAYGDKGAPRGILLKGPPGTGKSLVAQAFADCLDASFFKCSVAQIKGAHIGESAANVNALWAEARAKAPSVIFIDECEGAFPSRGSDQSDSFTNEAVQTFLTEWDGIGATSRVLIIGATNRPNLLDDAIISRFTDVIELTPPQGGDRVELVKAVARSIGYPAELPEAAFAQLSGLSGRDIRNVLGLAIRLANPDAPGAAHVAAAVAQTRGKSGTKTSDEARWDRLILPEKVLRELQVTAQMIREAEALRVKGIPVPQALLLYGPPGTGKTQIARTLANEAGLAFMAPSTAEFKGQYVGHAAGRVAKAFESARANSPCILFIDEIDALASARGGGDTDALQAEALTQLLQEMDGTAAKPGLVFVMAATNRLEALDEAVRSRFQKQIMIGLPDLGGRIALLQTMLVGRPVSQNLDIAALASRCENYSGRDLLSIITSAFEHAVQRTILEGNPVDRTVLDSVDIDSVLQATTPAAAEPA